MRTPLLQSIQSTAEAHPERCALADGNVRIDYATLDRFSAAFAERLLALGCRHGDRVVLLSNRRAVTVAAILGTFEAGAVHVPLDPRMPEARLAYILEEIAPAVVVTEESLRERVAEALPAEAPILAEADLAAVLERAQEAPASAGRPADDGSFDPAAPAYCIYTSGSTGRPKGVVIRHGSLPDFFEGTREFYDVREGAVCASFSPLHFDVFLMDMLFPLSEGATVHLHDDVVFPDLLFETIRANDVTHFSAWGRMLGLVAQARVFDSAPLPHLRTILTGTDVPDVKTVQRWLAKNEHVTVLNAYGPTEVTCAATAHPIREREPGREALYPIGKPFRHVEAFLVDDEGQRIETAGRPGELLLAGSQVMDGYWKLPEETAARLVEFEGVRCYRTGDVCTWLEDGSLLYQGRRDAEVNLGGYRVHTNEIQRVICSVPHVHAAEVVALESAYEGKILAAGVLLDPGHQVPRERIAQRLAEELPAYMIPRHIEILGEFPQLSSGKTDRKLLTVILEGRVGGGDEAAEAELRRTTATVLGIYQRVIGVEGIGPEGLFLDVGGNSLNLVEVLEQLEAEAGVVLDPRLFFEEETSSAEGIARAILDQQGETGASHE